MKKTSKVYGLEYWKEILSPKVKKEEKEMRSAKEILFTHVNTNRPEIVLKYLTIYALHSIKYKSYSKTTKYIDEIIEIKNNELPEELIQAIYELKSLADIANMYRNGMHPISTRKIDLILSQNTEEQNSEYFNTYTLPHTDLITFDRAELRPIDILQEALNLSEEIEDTEFKLLKDLQLLEPYNTLVKQYDVHSDTKISNQNKKTEKFSDTVIYVRDDNQSPDIISKPIKIPSSIKELHRNIAITLKNTQKIKKLRTFDSKEITKMEEITPGMTIFVSFVKPFDPLVPVLLKTKNAEGKQEETKIFGARPNILKHYKNPQEKTKIEQQNVDTQTAISDQQDSQGPDHLSFGNSSSSLYITLKKH